MAQIYKGPVSEHFSWEEAQHSDLAMRYGIDNSIPNQTIADTISATAHSLERVRTLFAKPIIVSSWYRCPDLNYKLKSKPSSQHVKGEAVDFTCPLVGDPLALCKQILHWSELVKFDQLILEFGWVHISFSSDPSVKNRGQVLSLLKTGGYASGLTNSEGIPL